MRTNLFTACVYVFCAFSSARATTGVVQRSLQSSVGAAELIVKGQVKKIERKTYKDGLSTRACGTTYTMKVNRTYKGGNVPELAFSVYSSPVRVAFHEVHVGDDLVLLLRKDARGTDPVFAEIPDVIYGSPSMGKARCLEQLEKLRLSAPEAAFPLVRDRQASAGSTEAVYWIAFSRSYTKMPTIRGLLEKPYSQDCAATSCEQDGRRLVRWHPIEEQILNWVRKIGQ